MTNKSLFSTFNNDNHSYFIDLCPCKYYACYLVRIYKNKPKFFFKCQGTCPKGKGNTNLVNPKKRVKI